MSDDAGTRASDEEPLVSVLVLTFDRPHYLRETLASVVAQSYRNLEIVVHDNASPMDPAPIVANFADQRIVLYRNGENVGVTRNLIAGFARCRGKYVAILGDDDVWDRDFLTTLVAPLERDESLVLAFCDHSIIDDDGRRDEATADKVTRRFGRHLLREGVHRPFDRVALVYRAICVISGAVLRRADFDFAALPRELKFGGDFYISYLAVRTGKACYYIKRRLSFYRYHRGSLTATLDNAEQKLQNAHDAMSYWSELLHDRTLTRDKTYFEMKLAFNALRAVAVLARCGDWRRAEAQFKHLWNAGLLRPRIFLVHLVWALRLHRAGA